MKSQTQNLFLIVFTALLIVSLFLGKSWVQRASLKSDLDYANEIIANSEAVIKIYENSIFLLQHDIAIHKSIVDSLQDLPERIRTVYIDRIDSIKSFSFPMLSHHFQSQIADVCSVHTDIQFTVIHPDTFALINHDVLLCAASSIESLRMNSDLLDVCETTVSELVYVSILQDSVICLKDSIIMNKDVQFSAKDSINISLKNSLRNAKIQRNIAAGIALIFLILK